MSDTNHIRKQVQQARELAQQGKYPQAKALLKGIDHPKVAALVTQLDAKIAAQPSATSKFPLLPVLGFVGIVLLLVVGGVFLLNASRQRPLEVVLPTLIPTVDCTPETVRAWWEVQDMALSNFAVDASSASRTMPGERLSAQVTNLRQFRTDFPPLPICASPEMQAAANAVLAAMDDTILAAERWSSGTTDGTQATNEFYAAEVALQEARIRTGQVIP